MWSETELAYLAGIIDGEGCVYIYKRKTRKNHTDFFPRLQLITTSKSLHEWIHKVFGGMIFNRKVSNPKWKPRFEWYTTRGLMDDILEKILPYMVIKKSHIQIMIEFRKTFKTYYGQKGVPQDVVKLREDLCSQLKLLNKRGL